MTRRVIFQQGSKFNVTPAASQSLESDSDGDTGDTPDDDTPRSVDLGVRARQFVDDTPQPETSHPDSDDEHYQNDPDVVLPENDLDVVNIEQLKSTGCGCNNNCMAKFQTQTLFKHILDVNEMEKSDKELYIMATLVDSSASSNETKRGKKRQRGRTEFKLLGKRVCKKVFILAFDIGKYSLKNIIAHVNEHGPVPRTQAGLGVKIPNALTYDDVHTLVQFISNYADDFGLPQPAAPRGRDNVPPIYLTSQTFKKDVHAKYEASCVESGTDCRVVRLTTFNNIWRQCVPHIQIATPRDDVCAVCETIRKEIMDASSEDEKLATTSKMQGHINSAQTEREIYNDCIKLARSSNDNNDHDKYVHYTFDFSQNVSIPHHSRQMGPVFFKSLRKIQLFGFRIDGHPKQLNFLIDEHKTIGKDGTATHGPNAVISMVDWAMEHYGTGEPTCSIHADNCPGQNKNQYVIGYFMWRVMTGKHRQVEYMMQVPGHARCLIDGGFASLKKLYRRTDCDTIDQLQEVVDKSSATNTAVRYPTWQWRDWKSFLGPVFRAIPGIRRYQYFRMSAAMPGVVVVRKSRDAVETAVPILRQTDFIFGSDDKPPVIPAAGLGDERQRYLHKVVRPFVRPCHQDVTCPAPMTQ